MVDINYELDFYNKLNEVLKNKIYIKSSNDFYNFIKLEFNFKLLFNNNELFNNFLKELGDLIVSSIEIYKNNIISNNFLIIICDIINFYIKIYKKMFNEDILDLLNKEISVCIKKFLLLGEIEMIKKIKIEF